MRGKNVMVLAFFNLIDNKNNGDRQDKQRMGVRTAMGAFMDTKIEWRLSLQVELVSLVSPSHEWRHSFSMASQSHFIGQPKVMNGVT